METQKQRQEPLTCQELVELVTAYQEGTLVPEARAAFDAHLAVCPPCVQYVQQMTTVVQLIGQTTDPNETAPGEDVAMQLFHAWQATRPAP